MRSTNCSDFEVIQNPITTKCHNQKYIRYSLISLDWSHILMELQFCSRWTVTLLLVSSNVLFPEFCYFFRQMFYFLRRQNSKHIHICIYTNICSFHLFFSMKKKFFFFATPSSMWDVSSLTREQTYTLCRWSRVLTAREFPSIPSLLNNILLFSDFIENNGINCNMYLLSHLR